MGKAAGVKLPEVAMMADRRDIHTKKIKKPKREAKKLVRVQPVVAMPVEVVRKHRKETIPE